MAGFMITAGHGRSANPIRYSISLKREQVRALLAELGIHPKDIVKATVRAINRTTKRAETRVVRIIRQHINIQQRDIRQGAHRAGGQVRIKRARTADDAGVVTITGKRIPVIRFGARETSSGVSYSILRGGGRKKIKEAFIGRGRAGNMASAAEAASGHSGVYRRVGPKRLPIIELFGPSIPHVAAASKPLAKDLKVDVGAFFEKDIAQQVNYILLKRRGAV